MGAVTTAQSCRRGVALALAACAALSCTKAAPQVPASGAARLTVSTRLGASDVSRVTVEIRGEHLAVPITQALALADGEWQITLHDLPIGLDTFTAAAYAADPDAPAFTGSAQALIVAGATALIQLALTPTGDPLSSTGPTLQSITISNGSPAPGAQVQLTVSASAGTAPGPLRYAWLASPEGSGSFDDASSQAPVWTAPRATGPVVLTATVTDALGNAVSQGAAVQVTQPGDPGLFSVGVPGPPQILSMSATLEQGLIRGESWLLAANIQAGGASVTSTWSTTGGCAGSFSATNQPGYLRFTLDTPASDGTCTLSLQVSSPAGSSNGTIKLSDTSAPTVDIGPSIIALYASRATVTPGVSINFNTAVALAHRTTLTYSWLASAGTFTRAADSGAPVWVAPSTCLPAAVTFQVTVTGSDGLKASGVLALPADPNWTCPTPQMPLITAAANVTQGLTYTAFIASPQAGITYSWSVDAGGTITGANTGPQIQFTAGTASTLRLSVQARNTLGAVASGSASLSVYPPVQVPVIRPKATALNQGASSQASVDAQANVTFGWTISGGTLTQNTGTTVAFTAGTSSALTLTATATHALTGDLQAASSTISVYALPAAPVISAPLSVVPAGTFSASVPASSTTTYEWFVDGATFINGTNAYTGNNPKLVAGASGTIELSCSGRNPAGGYGDEALIEVNIDSHLATFAAGSLIIPMQSSFQDPCGTVSAYGLVYSVLRANDGLRADPTQAHAPWLAPISVHWIVNSAKASPNRCVPTSIDQVYNGGTLLSPAKTMADPEWMDGCDFVVNNDSAAPVKLVNNSNTNATSDGNVVTMDTTTSIGQAFAFPNFKSRTVRFQGVPATDVTRVGYSGGAFVIDASDAPAFLALLQGTTIARDVAGSSVDFSPFRTQGSCNAVTSPPRSGTAQILRFYNPGSDPWTDFALVHHVNIHRAQIQFSAPNFKTLTAPPPRIGLVQSVDSDWSNEDKTSVLTGLVRGGTDPVFHGNLTGTPTGIKGFQLQPTFKSAGLSFATIAGCPPDGRNAAFWAAGGWTGSRASLTLCPNGAQSGLIYDYLDEIDLANGMINQVVDSNTPGSPARYPLLWMSHWEGRPWKTSAAPGWTGPATPGCDATCAANARTNVANYLNDVSTAHLLYAECASIGALEGAVNTAESSTVNTTCNPGYTTTTDWSWHDGVDPSLRCTSTGCTGVWTWPDPAVSSGALPGMLPGGNAARTFGTAGVTASGSGCYPNERYTADATEGVQGPTLGTQSLTCAKGSPDPRQCSTSPTPAPFGLIHELFPFTRVLPNCTDPTTAAGTDCIHFPDRTSAYAQVGDARWVTYGGGLDSYLPSASSTYKPGFAPLAYTISNLNPSMLSTNPRGMSIADQVSFIQRDDDSRKAQVLYFAGHNHTPDVLGTRIALNAWLSLAH
ncbi:MAG: hypothetical protein JST92_06105 [Deltaproteobacteria bacterium]|nr:hypothetical protein [Deltaproteobacteria bacterium]